MARRARYAVYVSPAAVVIGSSPRGAPAPILIHDGGRLIEAGQKNPVRTPHSVRACYLNSSPRCDQRALNFQAARKLL
jgi:hypothetical protein